MLTDVALGKIPISHLLPQDVKSRLGALTALIYVIITVVLVVALG